MEEQKRVKGKRRNTLLPLRMPKQMGTNTKSRKTEKIRNSTQAEWRSKPMLTYHINEDSTSCEKQVKEWLHMYHMWSKTESMGTRYLCVDARKTIEIHNDYPTNTVSLFRAYHSKRMSFTCIGQNLWKWAGEWEESQQKKEATTGIPC